MTGRRSHWTERGDDNIFLRLAIVVRLSRLWLRMGLLSWDPLVWILDTQVRRVLGGNDQHRAEKQNVVLTWFRPVTWSSGHLGRGSLFRFHGIMLWVHCLLRGGSSLRVFLNTQWWSPGLAPLLALLETRSDMDLGSLVGWKFQSRLKTSISLEISNLDLQNSPQKK